MKIGPPPPEDTGGRPGTGRTRWHLRANLPVVGWLLVLLGVALVHPFVPESGWLLVHLLLLGAVTNAIVVWSAHFTETLTRRAATRASRRRQTLRLVLLNLAIVAVVAGIVTGHWPAVLGGAVLVGAAVAWHGIALVLQARGALGNRFASTTRYYIAAATCLPIGAGLGAWLARDLADPWYGRVVLAHATVNLLGWVGLTVIGTLVTLWPTILRTRVADNAVSVSRTALPVLLGGLALAFVGALSGVQAIGGLGVGGYLAGLLLAAGPWVREARNRPPTTFAAWSVAAAVIWLAASLAGWAVVWATSAGPTQVVSGFGQLVAPLAVGFAAQVLLGALSYLVPVVLGGGPHATRAATEALERGAGLRLALVNAGLLVAVLPVPSIVRVAVSGLVLVALAAFLPLLGLAVRASHRAREQGPPPGLDRAARRQMIDSSKPRGRQSGLVAVGIGLLVLTIAATAAADPAALPGRQVESAAGAVAATGHTTTVQVQARDMRFHPGTITVPAGDRLVIELTNTDSSDVHDLALATGHKTPRLSPGESATLDVGVVGKDIEGWCTVVGHRQMGMVLQIKARGAAPAADAPGTGAAGGTAAGESAAGGHHAMGHSGNSDTDVPSAAADLDLMAPPPAGFEAMDATAPAPPSGRTPAKEPRTHRVTLHVREVVREVAPGVKQRLWTFNGTAPAPTLRGSVGDVFEITLVNDASMGHSIDFHASSVAPDKKMRTIAPGESLVYRFRATMAGIWLYHCGTMPMSVHMANGLFGALIIDPPGLPRVDHEYVLVQSELYLGPQGQEVDAAKLAAEQPDLVVFNGYANGYDHDPLPARVGERVRIWVLDAGPNRPTAFHVVGGQFDTVWAEGRYLLRSRHVAGGRSGGPDGAPPGESGEQGGSQALALQPSQGGFVELTFHEPGRYPFISHLMVDAERGAHGLFDVRG